MNKLRSFVFKLSKEPAALQAFKNDPTKALADADLDQHEKELLLKGDPQKLRRALNAEGDDGGPDSVTVVIWTHVHVKHIIAVEDAALRTDTESSTGGTTE